MAEQDNGNITIKRSVSKRIFSKELLDIAQTKEVDTGGPHNANFVIFPTGDEAGRIFGAGTLIETIEKPESNVINGRISDPTGTIKVSAHQQFQPEGFEMLSNMEAPAFVTFTGKVRTFADENNPDRLVKFVSLEFINTVDEKTRDHWVLETANLTEERLQNADLDEESKEKYRKMIETARADVNGAGQETADESEEVTEIGV